MRAIAKLAVNVSTTAIALFVLKEVIRQGVAAGIKDARVTK
jgi:hypothetical protein